MENISLYSFSNLTSNVTGNASDYMICYHYTLYVLCSSLSDILTVLLGQPVYAKLMWLIVTSKKTTDVLNLNLALFHNFQILISVFHLVSVLLRLPCQMNIVTFLFVYVLVGGPMTLSFICVERYVAVIHPTAYPLLRSYRCREVCAAAVWAVAVPNALACTFASDMLSSAAGKVLFSIPYVVMIFTTGVMIWCNSVILRALKRSGPRRDDGPHPVKRRAFKIVFAISAVAFLCYIAVIAVMLYQFVFVCTWVPMCISLLSIASVVHPILYLSSQGELFCCAKPTK